MTKAPEAREALLRIRELFNREDEWKNLAPKQRPRDRAASAARGTVWIARTELAIRPLKQRIPALYTVTP